MPLVQDSPYYTAYLVHDAPVNEKTLEVRKQFDVDEKTGYQRFYNWRPMAKLGPDVLPEDIFTMPSESKPEQYYSTQLVTGGLLGVSFFGINVAFNYYRGRPFWAAPYTWITAWAAACYATNWAGQKTHERANIKNQIYLDYVRKHPERFGPIHRPKFRECLFPLSSVRN